MPNAQALLVHSPFTLPTFPVGTPVGTPITNPSIYLMGDSITYGFSDPSFQGFKTFLGQYLTACGLSPTFIGPTVSGVAPWDHSHGITGSTVPDHNAGGPYQEQDFLGAGYEPDVIVNFLGTNDALNAGLTAAYQANQESLIDYVIGLCAAPPRIVLCSIPQVGDPTQNARVLTINATMPAIMAYAQGQGYNITFADLAAVIQTQPDKALPDRTHPNVAGHEKIAVQMAAPVLNACGLQAVWPTWPAVPWAA